MAKLQKHERSGGRFRHPGLEHDILYEPNYPHVGDYNSDCGDCDPRRLVQRRPRDDSEKDLFIYHQGRIATGNSVMMDGERRDSISKECGGAICIEMEAAGVDAVNGQCLVIRGISDYADSHKSDLWRSYAAGKAVAFARGLLERIPAKEVKKMPSGQWNIFYSGPVVSEASELNQEEGQPRQAPLKGVQDDAGWIHDSGERQHIPGSYPS